MFPEHQLYMPQADISLPTETTRKQGMERLRQPGQKLQGQDPHRRLSSWACPRRGFHTLTLRSTWGVRTEWKLSRSSLCLTPVLFPWNRIPSFLPSLLYSPALIMPLYFSSLTFASFCSWVRPWLRPHLSPPLWYPQSFGEPTGRGPGRLLTSESGMKKKRRS